MAVYVDKLIDYGWRHGPSCHLIADSVEELIEFAVSMGLRAEWYQPRSSPHFDLTAEGRAAAVAALVPISTIARRRKARSWPLNRIAARASQTTRDEIQIRILKSQIIRKIFRSSSTNPAKLAHRYNRIDRAAILGSPS